MFFNLDTDGDCSCKKFIPENDFKHNIIDAKILNEKNFNEILREGAKEKKGCVCCGLIGCEKWNAHSCSNQNPSTSSTTKGDNSSGETARISAKASGDNNLSSKVRNWDCSCPSIHVDDVKDFIKKLKVYFMDAKNTSGMSSGRISILPSEYRAIIDSLAGKRLLEGRKEDEM